MRDAVAYAAVVLLSGLILAFILTRGLREMVRNGTRKISFALKAVAILNVQLDFTLEVTVSESPGRTESPPESPTNSRKGGGGK